MTFSKACELARKYSINHGDAFVVTDHYGGYDVADLVEYNQGCSENECFAVYCYGEREL